MKTFSAERPACSRSTRCAPVSRSFDTRDPVNAEKMTQDDALRRVSSQFGDLSALTDIAFYIEKALQQPLLSLRPTRKNGEPLASLTRT